MISNMFKIKYLKILLIFLSTSMLFSIEYEIVPAELWINPANWNVNSPLPENIEDGEYYHLYEQQVLLEEKNVSQFKHHVIELTNIHGVENNSQISIDFDPAYEKLLLHNIDILRDGNKIDKLVDAKKELYHRETDMDALLYDGTKTFHAILNDVRPGDILDYSYTKVGLNPVFNNKFSKKYYLDWSVPVKKVYVRLINKKGTKLYFNYSNDIIEPIITKNTYPEYIWENDSSDILNWESNTPSWYNPLDTVEVTEFSSWLEMKKWAVALFDQRYNREEILNIYNNIVSEGLTPEEKLFLIIKWVQEEIRYLGLESGVDSHKPTTPDITLKRRFGDCKDKSFLAVELLDVAGIKAWPVLVNTRTGRNVDNSLPMTGLFNHAIIVAEIDNKRIWIDPTDTYQSGGLDSFNQPNYYNALILDDSENIFVSMDKKPLEIPNFKVVYNFDLRSEIPLFNVTAVNKFNEADYQRYKFDSTSKKEIQEGYLNYYTSYYQDITLSKIVEAKDSTSDNTFSTYEEYTIPGMWIEDDESDDRDINIYPIELSDYIKKPSDLRRGMPISLNYPLKVIQEINVHFDEKQGTFDDDNFKLSSDYIEFDFKSSFKNQILTNIFTYRTLKDHVPIEDVKQYLKDIGKIREEIGYSYYGEFEKENIEEKSSSINDVGFVIILISVIAYFINKNRKKRTQLIN